MNGILSFFQDIIYSNFTNQKPVGLSGFKHINNTKIVSRKRHKKEEMSISELLRRH